jgi:hypothetical protein
MINSDQATRTKSDPGLFYPLRFAQPAIPARQKFRCRQYSPERPA